MVAWPWPCSLLSGPGSRSSSMWEDLLLVKGEGLVTLTLSSPPFMPVLILWTRRVWWLGFGTFSLLSSSRSGGSRMWKVYCYSRAPGTRPGTFNQNSQAVAAAPDPVPAPQAAAAYHTPRQPGRLVAITASPRRVTIALSDV